MQFKVYTKPISLNNAYPANKQGHRYLTKEGKNYKELIAWTAKYAMKDHKLFTPPIEVKMIFYFPDNRRRDVDAPIKLTLDAMENVVYKNDCDIYAIYARKAIDKDNPHVSITIRRLKDYQPDGEIIFEHEQS